MPALFAQYARARDKEPRSATTIAQQCGFEELPHLVRCRDDGEVLRTLQLPIGSAADQKADFSRLQPFIANEPQRALGRPGPVHRPRAGES